MWRFINEPYLTLLFPWPQLIFSGSMSFPSWSSYMDPMDKSTWAGTDPMLPCALWSWNMQYVAKAKSKCAL